MPLVDTFPQVGLDNMLLASDKVHVWCHIDISNYEHIVFSQLVVLVKSEFC
jgi:hypothetical protein